VVCHISVRDIDFHSTTKGVRVRVTTDVPAHLYLRLSEQEPWVHRKPSIRRGVAFAEDVRFCFTVFEDNEQVEPGDTINHTWWKTSWPVCTTKWLYVWGSRAGEVCVSTTAPFEYHNDGIDPIPVGDIMYTFNSIEPELHGCGSGSQWNTINLKHDLPPDATGIIFKVNTTPISGDKKMGFRKPGSGNINTGRLHGGEHQWGLVGVSDTRTIEVYGPAGGNLSFWVLGYTGRNVHFLDTVINLTPALPLVWQDVNVSPHIPAGAIPIFDLSYQGYAFKRYSVQPKGGAFKVWSATAHNWITISPDYAGIVQFYLDGVGPTRFQLLLTGYIDGGSTFHIDPLDRTPANLAVWDNVPITALPDTTKWCVLESGNANTAVLHGVRKKDSLRDDRYEAVGHSWVYAHTNPTPMVQIYRPTVDFVYWEYGATV